MRLDVKPTCQFDSAFGNRTADHRGPAPVPNLCQQLGDGLNLRPAVCLEVLQGVEPSIILFAGAAARPLHHLLEVEAHQLPDIYEGHSHRLTNLEMREQVHRHVDGRRSLSCRHQFRIERIAGSAPFRGRLVKRPVLKSQDLVDGVADPLRKLEVPGASTLGTPSVRTSGAG